MIYFGATSGNALNYSLEFVGGTSTTADFGKDYTAAEVEKDIVPSVSNSLAIVQCRLLQSRAAIMSH